MEEKKEIYVFQKVAFIPVIFGSMLLALNVIAEPVDFVLATIIGTIFILIGLFMVFITESDKEKENV